CWTGLELRQRSAPRTAGLPNSGPELRPHAKWRQRLCPGGSVTILWRLRSLPRLMIGKFPSGTKSRAGIWATIVRTTLLNGTDAIGNISIFYFASVDLAFSILTQRSLCWLMLRTDLPICWRG